LHGDDLKRVIYELPPRQPARSAAVRVRRAECPHSGELVRRERGERVAAFVDVGALVADELLTQDVCVPAVLRKLA
jgi:hypothetical protein